MSDKIPALFQLVQEKKELLEEYLEADELTPALEIKIEENSLLLKKKCDQYFWVYDLIKHELDFYSKHKQDADKTIKFLKKKKKNIINVLSKFKEQGIDLSGNEGKWVEYSLKGEVIVLDQDKLPMDCLRVNVEPDKEKIKQKILSGEITSDIAYIKKGKSIKYKKGKVC